MESIMDRPYKSIIFFCINDVIVLKTLFDTLETYIHNKSYVRMICYNRSNSLQVYIAPFNHINFEQISDVVSISATTHKNKVELIESGGITKILLSVL